MKKILVLTILLSALVSFGQSKKEQIEILNSRVDSLEVVINNERQNFDIALDSLNQVLGKTQQYFEIEIANYSIKINNLNTQIDSLISINDSINLQLKIKNQNIDSLKLEKLELLANIDSLSTPRIDNEESEFLSLFSGKTFSRGIDESEEFIRFTPYEECAVAFIGSYWADGPSLKIYTINFEEKELVLVGIRDCTNAMGFGYRLKYIDKNTISVIPMCCESDLNCDDAFFGFFHDLRGNPCNSFLLSN